MVKLLENFYLVSNPAISHKWDANAYFIPGKEPTLIDCGCILGLDYLRKNLAELGYSLSDIRRVIGTHGHWDHISSFNEISKESRAELLLHPDDVHAIEEGDSLKTAAFLYGLNFPPTKTTKYLFDGDVLIINGYMVKIHHTPGHSPGSISLEINFEGKKILIAGDTLWGGFHQNIGSNMDDWKSSLEKLMKLDIDFVTFGHSMPEIYPDANTRIKEAAESFGVLLTPWFKPFNVKFRY